VIAEIAWNTRDGRTRRGLDFEASDGSCNSVAVLSHPMQSRYLKPLLGSDNKLPIYGRERP
jgi:hypothetical protein